VDKNANAQSVQNAKYRYSPS